MYLTSKAFQSIFNAVPPPKEDLIRVVGDQEQRELLERWCKEIENAKNDCNAQLVRITYGSKPQMCVDVTIRGPSDARYYTSYGSQQLRLKFVHDILRVGAGYTDHLTMDLANIQQFWQIVDGIKKKMLELKAREQKQKKIRDLKTRSVEAQVEDLAQRLQFAYQLTRKHTKVVLAIELDTRQSLLVDIPLGKIQQTMERLESLIQQVKVLYGEGLRFKIAASPYGHFQRPKPVE